MASNDMFVGEHRAGNRPVSSYGTFHCYSRATFQKAAEWLHGVDVRLRCDSGRLEPRSWDENTRTLNGVYLLFPIAFLILLDAGARINPCHGRPSP